MQSLLTHIRLIFRFERGMRPHERETMMDRDNASETRAVMMLTMFPIVVALTWTATPASARVEFVVAVATIVVSNILGSLPWHRWPRWLEPSMPILSIAGSWLWAASIDGYGSGYSVLAIPPLVWLSMYADPPDVAAGFVVLSALALTPADALFDGLPEPGSTNATVSALLLTLLVCISIRPLVVALRMQVRDARRATWSLRASQAALAHDLRNPLTSIGALADLANDRLQPPTDLPDLDATREYLTRVRDLVARAEQTIAGVLELSQAGNALPAADPIDLPTMLRELAREVDGIVLVIDGVPRTIIGHGPSIRRVFANLFENASSHGRRGPGPVRVTIRGSDTPTHWRFEVADDGPGFGDTDTTLLLEPWRRGEQATNDGSGLGLAIVAAIVTQHGGEVDIDSTRDRGATVAFTISRAPRVAPVEH